MLGNIDEFGKFVTVFEEHKVYATIRWYSKILSTLLNNLLIQFSVIQKIVIRKKLRLFP